MTRQSLLLRLRNRDDQEAWTEFHALYAPLVVKVARRYLSPADCEDVLQEVMLGFTSSMSEFEYDPQRGRFRGLLQTIAQRAIAKKRRQVGAAPSKMELDGCVARDVDDESWEQAWRQYHLERALRRLEPSCSERDRLAFRRYAIEGADAASTAAEFGMGLEQLYQIKSRLLKKLSQLVAAQVQAEDEHD